MSLQSISPPLLLHEDEHEHPVQPDFFPLNAFQKLLKANANAPPTIRATTILSAICKILSEYGYSFFYNSCVRQDMPVYMKAGFSVQVVRFRVFANT